MIPLHVRLEMHGVILTDFFASLFIPQVPTPVPRHRGQPAFASTTKALPLFDCSHLISPRFPLYTRGLSLSG
jgi:hypothetical protein